jgi:hypothetical protein
MPDDSLSSLFEHLDKRSSYQSPDKRSEAISPPVLRKLISGLSDLGSSEVEMQTHRIKRQISNNESLPLYDRLDFT